MAARDLIHNAVRNALVKDGWHITHDPLYVRYKGERVYVNLGARRLLAAQRGEEKIAVEIKSFIGRSLIDDVENALGQYLLYRNLLLKAEPDRIVFLAMTVTAHSRLTRREALSEILSDYDVKLIVVDELSEEVTLWKTS